MLAQLSQNFKTINFREHNIKQNGIERALQSLLKSAFP
jgi:hypothetical protein